MLDLRVKKIIADIAQARGEEFFPQIVQSLAETINADITFIATLRDQDQQAATVAVVIDGQLSEDFSYALKDTPCEQVGTGNVCCYDSNVQRLFPNDDLLKEMGANSYVGVPLYDSEGAVVGILASLFRGGLGDQEVIEALYLLFSGLISSELGRRDYLRDYKLAAAVIDNVNEAVIITDRNSYITYVNPAFETISGYSAKEAIGKKSDLLRSNQHTQLFHEEMKLKIAANQSWSGEIFNKRKNGEIYPERISVNAIRDEKNILRHYVCFFSDISERKKTEDELNFQSHYDSLTQLPNMEQFIHIVNENIGKPQSKKFAVAIIDIDNFRGVNDSYGHAFGNRFLKKVSQRLSQAKRSQDTLSRFGGDQFPLLINNIDGPHQASKIISEIQQQLKAPFFINNQEINITSRVGVSIYPNDSDCAEQLVSNANQSLVYAEQRHDNRYSFFAPSMRQDSERRMYLKSAMIKSIIQQSFKLAFQPIIDIQKQRVSKFEVLLRWQYNDEWISPAEFIPVAEEFDLIKPLGELVLEKSCLALQALRAAGHTDISFAINRSIHEFPTATEGAKYWLDTLEKHDIPAQAICFEITESILAPDSKEQIILLNDLKSAGCSLAIDDFGTGYSSLSYLRKFPVDVLKIDRSFISDQQSDNNDWRLVSSIIAMAKVLGQKVVAEGVENNDQLQQLMALDCDYIQGFLFSKPLAEDGVQHYINHFDFNAVGAKHPPSVAILNQ